MRLRQKKNVYGWFQLGHGRFQIIPASVFMVSASFWLVLRDFRLFQAGGFTLTVLSFYVISKNQGIILWYDENFPENVSNTSLLWKEKIHLRGGWLAQESSCELGKLIWKERNKLLSVEDLRTVDLAWNLLTSRYFMLFSCSWNLHDTLETQSVKACSKSAKTLN